MSRLAKGFLFDHVSSHVIRCSFCTNIIRKDVPIGTETPRGLHNDVKTTLGAEATAAGWKAAMTTHDSFLNFCPDHVHLAIEMGVLK